MENYISRLEELLPIAGVIKDLKKSKKESKKCDLNTNN